MTRCLVLGGAGFIGSHLCNALLSENYAVRIFDRPGSKFVPLADSKNREFSSNIEFYEGDYLNKRQVDEAVEGCDIVFHLISTTVPASSNADPSYDISSNVIGSINLIQSCIQHNIKKFVYVSSGGTIYGVPTSLPIPEVHPCNPICSYGIGKLAVEKYLHLYQYLNDLDYCVIRLSNPYGWNPNVKKQQGVINVFIDQIIRHQHIEVWGDGSVIRDYIHIDDAVSALIAVLKKNVKNDVFNIGAGEGASIRDLLDILRMAMAFEFTVDYKGGRKFDVPEIVLDISKARRQFGWQPIIKLEESVSVLVADTLKSR